MKDNELKDLKKALYDYISLQNESIKESTCSQESERCKRLAEGAIGLAHMTWVISGGQYLHYMNYLNNNDNFDKILSDLG